VNQLSLAGFAFSRRDTNSEWLRWLEPMTTLWQMHIGSDIVATARNPALFCQIVHKMGCDHDHNNAGISVI